MDFLDVALKVAGIIGALGVPGVIGYYLRRNEGREVAIRRARQEETRLTLEGIKAIGKLSHATAIAVRDKKVNGVMENAITGYESYSNELDAFLTQQAVEKNH